MDATKTKAFVGKVWDDSIVPTITEYIKIPNKSPLFDPQWKEHGHMDRAVALVSGFRPEPRAATCGRQHPENGFRGRLQVKPPADGLRQLSDSPTVDFVRQLVRVRHVQPEQFMFRLGVERRAELRFKVGTMKFPVPAVFVVEVLNRGAEEAANHYLSRAFFAHFAGQRLFQRFAGINAAAGKQE